jgi:YfiH family protein
MKHRPSLALKLAAAGLDWIVPDWPAPPNVCALSTTRNASAHREAHADLGGDALLDELARWIPASPIWLRQVHGAAIHDADASEASRDRPRADGVVARRIGRVCAIETADCLPILFASSDGAVVAAAHAGWRGLAAGVIEATLAGMQVPPSGVMAWLGPCIGAGVYEVGRDVLDAHCAADSGAAECFLPVSSGKWLADLRALAVRRLSRAGVHTLAGVERCTFSEDAVFYSYRRDGARAGRMASLIWRTA